MSLKEGRGERERLGLSDMLGSSETLASLDCVILAEEDSDAESVLADERDMVADTLADAVCEVDIFSDTDDDGEAVCEREGCGERDTLGDCDALRLSVGLAVSVALSLIKGEKVPSNEASPVSERVADVVPEFVGVRDLLAEEDVVTEAVAMNDEAGERERLGDADGDFDAETEDDEDGRPDAVLAEFVRDVDIVALGLRDAEALVDDVLEMPDED